jgi:hypothetical protein
VAAVAANFGDILIGRIPAVIAAILLIAAYCACTSIMSAPVVVSHSRSPKIVSNFAIGR